MLGYVKCQAGEMLVKHHALYRAMYCGLCHATKTSATRAMLPFLSYDFVFLAFLRALILQDTISLEKEICLLHPFRKGHQRVAENDALRYSAAVSLFLTHEKMRDDRRDGDSPFFRRFLLSLSEPILSRRRARLCRKQPSLSSLSEALSRTMEEGREAEQKSASLDDMCKGFGQVLSLVFSFGTEGTNKRFLAALGGSLGRLLYVVDAIDDLEKDEKSGAFNPLLSKYGSCSHAKGAFPDLDLVTSFEISQMKATLDLLDGDKDLIAVCDHIITVGLPAAVSRVMKSKNGEKE